MTTKVIAVLLAGIAAVVIASAALDFARRSLTVLIVAALAFGAGWMVGIGRRRDVRRPDRDGRDPQQWEER